LRAQIAASSTLPMASSVDLPFLKPNWSSFRPPDRPSDSFSRRNSILSRSFPAVSSMHKGRKLDALAIGLSGLLRRRTSLACFYLRGSVDCSRHVLYNLRSVPGDSRQYLVGNSVRARRFASGETVGGEDELTGITRERLRDP